LKKILFLIIFISLIPNSDAITTYSNISISNDTYSSQGNSNSNYGDDIVIQIMQESCCGTQYRGYINFTITNQTINTAKLYLHSYGSFYGQSISIYNSTSGWGEFTLTWNNQPNKNILLTTHVLTNGWNSIDITDEIKGQMNGTKNKYGLIIDETLDAAILKKIYSKEGEFTPFISLEVEKYVTTLNATSSTTKSVTMNLNRSDDTINPVWFEYGLNTGNYIYKTDNVTLSSGITTYSKKIDDFPLQAGQTYYYRAMSSGYTGSEITFTLPRVSEITGYDFSPHYNETVDANFNITEYGTVLPKVYTDLMGGIFYGIIISTIFIVIWIRQDDVTIPALLGILTSFGLSSLLPDEYLNVAYSLMVVSIAGLIYSYFWGKR